MSDIELLKRIVEYEKQHIDEWRAKEKRFKEEYGEDIKYGWSWSDVGIHPSSMWKLTWGYKRLKVCNQGLQT